MKFKLVETLHPLLGNDSFITDNEYDVKNLLLNKPKAYRILWDKNIDTYMLCDANDFIHYDMIKKAFKDGYYAEAENDTDIDGLVREWVSDTNRYVGNVNGYIELGCDGYYFDDDDNEVDFGQYLLYMIYVPEGMDADSISYSPGSDGYDDEIDYKFGTMYIRDADLDIIRECGLLQLLNKEHYNR